MDINEIQGRIMTAATALEQLSAASHQAMSRDVSHAIMALISSAEIIARDMFSMAEEMDRSLAESRAAEQVNGGAVDAWFAENRGRLMDAWRADCS